MRTLLLVVICLALAGCEAEKKEKESPNPEATQEDSKKAPPEKATPSEKAIPPVDDVKAPDTEERTKAKEKGKVPEEVAPDLGAPVQDPPLSSWKVTSVHLEPTSTWSKEKSEGYLNHRVDISANKLVRGLSEARIALKNAPGITAPDTCGPPSADPVLSIEPVGPAPFQLTPYFATLQGDKGLLFGDGISLCMTKLGEEETLIISNMVIKGFLDKRTVMGPPGYGETPELDEDEVWMMVLEEPLPGGQQEVMIAPNSDKTSEAMLAFAGTTLSLKGNLEHGHTGHHHTPYVLFDAELLTKDPSLSFWTGKGFLDKQTFGEEEVWVMVLEEPLVDGGIDLMIIPKDAKAGEAMLGLAGTSPSLKGSLEEAHSAHHHTPFVLFDAEVMAP